MRVWRYQSWSGARESDRSDEEVSGGSYGKVEEGGRNVGSSEGEKRIYVRKPIPECWRLRRAGRGGSDRV
jgi:hypothetical protein